jgi:hypothetical protein
MKSYQPPFEELAAMIDTPMASKEDIAGVKQEMKAMAGRLATRLDRIEHLLLAEQRRRAAIPWRPFDFPEPVASATMVTRHPSRESEPHRGRCDLSRPGPGRPPQLSFPFVYTSPAQRICDSTKPETFILQRPRDALAPPEL